jgi:serine/threonine-protein kinase
MCTILEYLHNLTPPVVHRDFTPDNLILRKDGTLKLVDFNVAQQTESTATGTVVGKHAYLPPEQFRGLPTTQSDIYAMGATLYYILTAQDPEPISEAHPRTVRSEISEEFDTLIGRATAIDAKLRYQRAEEIAADLGAPAEKLNV